MKVDCDITDDISIHCGTATLTVAATDIIDFVRGSQGLPLLRPQSTHKTCPNPDCAGGWAPDLLTTGRWLCPVCKEEFDR